GQGTDHHEAPDAPAPEAGAAGLEPRLPRCLPDGCAAVSCRASRPGRLPPCACGDKRRRGSCHAFALWPARGRGARGDASAMGGGIPDRDPAQPAREGQAPSEVAAPRRNGCAMNPDVMIPKPGPVTPRVAAPVTRTVDVVVCTFRRPHVVETLATLDAQELTPGTEMRIIVIDNDTAPTARATVLGKAEEMRFPVAYFHAPGPNISLARNAGLDMADADLVAFIDDDCLAERRWLAALVARLETCDVDAVFGPSRAVFGATGPGWVGEQDHPSNGPGRRGGEVCTGHTCNALLRWRGTPWRRERFDLARGRSGG